MGKFYTALTLFILIVLSLFAQGSWHPELEHWPRTVLEANALQIVRERVLTEPYSDFYVNINAESEIEYTSCNRERDKAEVCRSAAFRFLIDSEDLYAEKSLEYLLIAEREQADDYIETYENIIWDSENLTSLCTAYDFLKGNNFDFGEAENTVRENIKSIASGLYYDVMEHYLIHIAWETTGRKNNFGVKLASALGIAAIVLNTETSNEIEEQPLTWINYSMEILYDIFGQYQVDEDGGWAEGAHYQSYVAFNLIPFLFSHHNFLDGASEDYNGLVLPPWLVDENFQNTLIWGMRIRMPNGARPNFDDSFNNPYYYNGIFANFYDEDLFAWDHIDSSDPYYTNTNPGDISIEMICNLDDIYPGTTEPDILTMFLPNSGQAIFRSGWDEDAVYMCLMGENGIARTGGMAHEHPDNMSFIIHAYGELLAMDCGYISYDQHDLVRYADNHSLILVDGEGPSASNSAASGGSDAYIQDYFDLPELDYAEVVTNYQNTDFSRSMSFVQDSFFILADIINGSEIHTYDWLLHGNGGGDTGNSYQLTENTAVYNANGIELNVFHTTDHSIFLDNYDDYHEVAYETAGEHTVTRASLYAANAVLSAFLVPAPENTEINYTPFDIENCAGGILEMDNKSTVTFVKDNNYQIDFEFDQIPVSTNARVTNIQKTETEIPTIIQLVDATTLVYNDVNLIESSITTDVNLNISEDSADGYVKSACQLNLFTGNTPTAVNGVLSYTYDAGILTLDLAEDTYFHLDVNWSLVNTGTDDDVLTETAEILGNHPNPFNPETLLTFSLSTPGNAEIMIYNVQGQLVRTLINMSFFSEGYNSISWDGKNDSDEQLSSGIYIYKLKTSRSTYSRKMIMLK